MRLAKVFLIAALLPPGLGAQSDPWTALQFLEGKWQGEAAGEPGKGISTREYRFDLNGRFLSVRNKAVYEPKTPDQKPEVHEDFGFFSYDRAQKTFVLREFHGEGFVNEYQLNSGGSEGSPLEFVTTQIENIPEGWRAKEIYRVVSPDEFVETFFLAAPEKDFELYSETHLRRLK